MGKKYNVDIYTDDEKEYFKIIESLENMLKRLEVQLERLEKLRKQIRGKS